MNGRTSTVATATLLAATLFGCASAPETSYTQESGRQKKDMEATMAEADAKQRAAYASVVQQKWPRLKKGMSLKQAESLLGPLTPGEIQGGADYSGGKATTSWVAQIYTCRYDLCGLSFKNGKLDQWLLAK